MRWMDIPKEQILPDLTESLRKKLSEVLADDTIIIENIDWTPEGLRVFLAGANKVDEDQSTE